MFYCERLDVSGDLVVSHAVEAHAAFADGREIAFPGEQAAVYLREYDSTPCPAH